MTAGTGSADAGALGPDRSPVYSTDSSPTAASSSTARSMRASG